MKVKKTRSSYTRKQICEAIAYWKSLLNENTERKHQAAPLIKNLNDQWNQHLMSEADGETDAASVDVESLKQAVLTIQDQLDSIKAALSMTDDEGVADDVDGDDDMFASDDDEEEDDEEEDEDEDEEDEDEE